MIPAQAVHRVAAIRYVLSPYDWAFPHEQAAAVETFWSDATMRNAALFDGRVLVAHRLALVGDRFEAEGFETGFKPFLAWREFGFPGAPLVNLFAMAALRSADGAFMLGRMGGTTANPGRLYFPAGTPEPADARDGVVDLDANVLRELEEETGITATEVERGTGWTLVFDHARIACMAPMASPLPAAELVARFQAVRAAQAEPELDALVPVRGPDDLDPVHMPPFMLMFLREAFAAV